MKRCDIGFEKAYGLALAHVRPLAAETLPISEAYDRIAAETITALVDSPSIDASMKDGYAVISRDIETASTESPVRLAVIGRAAAGIASERKLTRGKTIRVLSGAEVPPGSDAVLAEEFVTGSDGEILARADSPPGKNILPRGSDVRRGDVLVEQGTVLTPQRMSLAAAGGVHTVAVVRRPRVGMLATGSEVLLPGSPMEAGKLFASNAVLQQGWLKRYGLDGELRLAEDEREPIQEAVGSLIAASDVILTSGGAWKGDRDLIVSVLESMGWNQVFHRVRMGPGKAVGMGFLHEKPVFCLPGGPTSNELAFLMIALPAILKMAGCRRSPFQQHTGRLTREIRGDVDWTQFVECMIGQDSSGISLQPEKHKSRLASMARTQAIVKIPEGVRKIAAGTRVPFYLMDPDIFTAPML